MRGRRAVEVGSPCGWGLQRRHLADGRRRDMVSRYASQIDIEVVRSAEGGRGELDRVGPLGPGAVHEVRGDQHGRRAEGVGRVSAASAPRLPLRNGWCGAGTRVQRNAWAGAPSTAYAIMVPSSMASMAAEARRGQELVVGVTR